MQDDRSDASTTRRQALAILAAAPAVAQATETKPGHPVVFFEIGCRDRAKSEHFFAELFGWPIQPGGPSGTIDMTGQKGIPGHINSLGHEPQHYTMFYVEVEDLQSYLDKAVSLGGKVLVPPVKIPTGAFAWIADIDGNMIGLLKR